MRVRTHWADCWLEHQECAAWMAERATTAADALAALDFPLAWKRRGAHPGPVVRTAAQVLQELAATLRERIRAPRPEEPAR